MKIKYKLTKLKFWLKHRVLDKKIKFLVYGDLDVKQNHARDLLNAVQDLSIYCGNMFEIIITGKNKFPNINPQVREYIKFCNIKTDKEFEKVCKKADYFVPILGLSDEIFLRLRSYEKPFIVDYRMGYNFNLREDSSIYYEDYFELYMYMKAAMFIMPEDYTCMCENVKHERKSVFSRKIGCGQ
ncbi:hypothetical protein J6E39_05650 [bacterium]|nr:hypothetical protein [bacterium]